MQDDLERRSPHPRSQQPADRQIYQGAEDELIVGDLIEEIPEDSQKLAALKEYVLSSPTYPNWVISPDGQLTTITLELNPYVLPESGEEDLLGGFDDTAMDADLMGGFDEAAATDGPDMQAVTSVEENEAILAAKAVMERYEGRKLSNFHLWRPGLRVFHPRFDAVEPTQVFGNFNWADVPAFAGPVSPNFWGTAADPVGGAEHGGHPWIHGSLRSSVHCHQSDFAVFHSSDWGCGCCARADDLLPTQNGWQFQGGFSCLRSQPFGASHCDDEFHDCWRVVVLCQRGLGADCRFGYLRRTRGPGGNGTYPDLVACNFGGTTRRATTTLWSQRSGSG